MGLYALFREKFPQLALRSDVSLSRRTTVGCGGEVELAVFPSDAEEAAAVLAFLKKERIPHAFLGAGANTLPPSGRQEGVLVCSDRLSGLVREGTTVFAGAGVRGGALLRFASLNGLGGFEPFVGIPTSVGGACVMNAGVRERHMADCVVSVLAVRGGRIESFPRPACAFGEKTSLFQEGIFVVGALLRAEPASAARSEGLRAAYLARRSRLPKGRSMGCVFVNPEGKSAGELIDACGLKGLSVGGARVSDVHANFIINDGGTSEDVSSLIERVKLEVFERTGVLLREEIRRLKFCEDG